MAWNHNVQHHDIVIRAIPPHCGRALDVGCGRGSLAQKLAPRCGEVLAIDSDSQCLEFAGKSPGIARNITFLQGDVQAAPLEEGSFEFVTAVATLHHLPLKPALERFRRLLSPGGVIAIIGLYRNSTVSDYAIASIAFPVSRIVRAIKGTNDVGAPLRDPVETLQSIRSSCEELLPGGIFRRHLFFRYSFVWRKPTRPSKSPEPH